MHDFTDSDRQLLKETHGIVMALKPMVDRMRIEVDAHDSRLDVMSSRLAAINAVEKFKGMKSEFNLKEAAILVALGSAIIGILTSAVKVLQH